MHRLQATLIERWRGTPLERPARALQRAGVRATYRLHDLVLSNRASRRLYASHTPELDGVQQKIVASLRAEGVATAPFTSLFPAHIWQALVEDASRFVKATEEEIERERSAPADGGKKRKRKSVNIKEKDYIRRRFGKGTVPVFDPSDPWLILPLQPRMLDIANAYLGLWSKLVYSDEWYTVPSTDGAERRASQRWHRDYADRHLLKVFIYLNDVDQGTGPFEYLPETTGTGRYAGQWPWRPISDDFYPPGDEFDRRIPSAAARTLTGPAGTMIFCDTSGFHRGGFATERPRVLWTFSYFSPASLRSLSERQFSVDPARVPADLPAAARFALS